MYYTNKNLKAHAIAPHAYLPVFPDDKNPMERELALKFGLKLLDFCDILLVCGSAVSNGMRAEIVQALSMGKPVYCYNPVVYAKINFIAAEECLRRDAYSLNPLHPVLGKNAAELFDELEVAI